MNDVIRLLRIFHHFTIQELGDNIGLSKGYLSQLEQKRKPIGLSVLKKYAEFFNLNLLDFFMMEQSLLNDEEMDTYTVNEKIKAIIEWESDVQKLKNKPD